MRNLLKLFLLISGLLTLQTVYGASAIHIDGAWVRAVPPTSKVTAAYMNIHNESDKEIALISGSTEAFKTVELHQTVFEGELAKMIQQDKINIPAKGMTALKPGDYHIMLIGRKVDLNIGDTVTLTLQFSDETTQTLQVEVKYAEMPMMKHHKH